ncbi:MAG: hypothetical protein MHM6MM_003936, partial [Cercozoa sp. M6MM]
MRSLRKKRRSTAAKETQFTQAPLPARPEKKKAAAAWIRTPHVRGTWTPYCTKSTLHRATQVNNNRKTLKKNSNDRNVRRLLQLFQQERELCDTALRKAERYERRRQRMKSE